MDSNPHSVLVLGSGPGALACAVVLARSGYSVEVLEKEGLPGGLIKPIRYQDYCVDFGFKQLYARIPEVTAYWSDLLGESWLPLPIRVGVLYKGRVLDRQMGMRGWLPKIPPRELGQGLLDLIRGRMHAMLHAPQNLEERVHQRQGKTFARMFSQTFYEKTTGRLWRDAAPVEWLTTANNSLPSHHPRRGSGQIVEKSLEVIRQLGGSIHLGAEVLSLRCAGSTVQEVVYRQNGVLHQRFPQTVVSGLPLMVMARLLQLAVEPIPNEVSFQRRTKLVYLFLKEPCRLAQHMLKITTPGNPWGRIANYAAYPGTMVPKGKGCLCLEMFLTGNPQHDPGEVALQQCAISWMQQEGLIKSAQVEHAFVLDQPGADAATGWEDYREEGTRYKLFQHIEKQSGLLNVSRPGVDKATHAGLLAAAAIINPAARRAFQQRTRPDLPQPWNTKR